MRRRAQILAGALCLSMPTLGHAQANPATTTSAAGGPANQAPAPPGGVKAALYGNTVSITWNPAPGLRYQIDRGTVAKSGPANWQVVTMDLSAYGYSYGLQDYTPGMRLIYRVTAKDSLGRQSQPALSNEIVATTSPNPSIRVDTTPTADTTTGGISSNPITNVRPAMIAEPSRLNLGDQVLKVASASSFSILQLKKVHWTSLDESVATVDAQGQVRARAPGYTYIIANGIAPDGSVASLVKRIDVVQR
jgi:Bacterial Ig-like domain (group 2)